MNIYETNLRVRLPKLKRRKKEKVEMDMRWVVSLKINNFLPYTPTI